VIGVVPDCGAGNEMVPVDQLWLGFGVFDDQLQFFEKILGDLTLLRFGLNDSVR
jgi:hypothetical protein